MNHFKLSIPVPCHESWDNMVPNPEGRFCGQCQKNVTDFTGMTDAQINTYMLLNNGKTVCGRFKNTQIESIVIQIPAKALYTQTSFRKVFMLALLITMGTTLLSCADNLGNKHPIEQVVVTDSTVTGYNSDVKNSSQPRVPHTTGMVIMNERDTLNAPLPPPPLEQHPAPKSIVNKDGQ